MIFVAGCLMTVGTCFIVLGIIPSIFKTGWITFFCGAAGTICYALGFYLSKL